MKTSKRILATIVAVMLVMTSLTVPTFAAFTDVAEDSGIYSAVNVLNKLGVINGYPDGSFGSERNVTRAEFTAMLLRTRGMGSVGSSSTENLPFSDVASVTWAIANIRTAHEMGIINGFDDGTFKPNDPVLYEQAVKMIVCALGYGNMGTEGAAWYSRYLMSATSLGFLDGAGGKVGTPATRATIASMLYSCLEVNLAEDNKITNKTVLENDLQLTKKVGYIDSNAEISLSQANPNIRDNEVQIRALNENGVLETETYRVENAAEYNNMLGAQITFYYKHDRQSNFKHLILATVKDTETVEISAVDIYDSTPTSIEYLKSSDAKNTTIANIAAQNVVVYNGKLYEGNTFQNYRNAKGMPTIGSIKLLDRDGDNQYDVVFVEDYKVWVVSSATASNQSIVDNVIRNNETKSLDPEETGANVNIVDKAGKEVGFSSIKKGSVVAIKESNNGGKVITAVVLNDSVSGKITATDSKKGVTINGKIYKFSKQAPWKNGGTMTEPKYGESGRFYLDIDGNIIAYDKTEAVVTQNYGYMTDVEKESDGFSDKLMVAISTKNDPRAQKAYEVTTKTKIIENGVSTPVTDLTTAEGTLTAKAKGKGVKFTVGKNDEIDELVVATSTPTNGVESDKLYLYDGAGKSGDSNKWGYSATSRVLTLKSDTSKTIHIASATILSVKGGTSKYKTMSLSEFSQTSDYWVEAYDLTNTGSAKFLIVYDSTFDETQVRASSPVMFVESADPVYDSVTGESKRVLKGYVGKTYHDDWVLSSTDSETQSVAATLKEGDVVRLGKDGDGYTIKANNIIFRTDANYRATALSKGIISNTAIKWEQNENGSKIYQVVWGSAYQYDGDDGTRFIMSTDVLAASNSTPSGRHEFEKGWFSSAKIYEYDVENDKFIDKTNDGHENVLGGLSYSTGTAGGAKPSEMFVYMNGEMSVGTVIIMKTPAPTPAPTPTPEAPASETPITE